MVGFKYIYYIYIYIYNIIGKCYQNYAFFLSFFFFFFLGGGGGGGDRLLPNLSLQQIAANLPPEIQVEEIRNGSGPCLYK